MKCTLQSSCEQLASDTASLITRLSQDKPDLVWILSQETPKYTVNDKVQVAARLICNMQRQEGRHSIIENINTEKPSEAGIFWPDTIAEMVTQRVWLCNVNQPANQKLTAKQAAKAKHVESHYDDCGTDATELEACEDSVAFVFNTFDSFKSLALCSTCFDSDSDESDEFPCFSQSFFASGFPGSEASEEIPHEHGYFVFSSMQAFYETISHPADKRFHGNMIFVRCSEARQEHQASA